MNMICRNKYGIQIQCPIGVEDEPIHVQSADDDPIYHSADDVVPERDQCAFNLPNFPINTKKDFAKAINYIVKNNTKACVGPAFETMCSRIPAALRKQIPAKYRSSCNANTGTKNSIWGMSGLGAYTTKADIVAAVQRCKKSGTWENFNRCAADIMANTAPSAAKYLPTPFRQMYAAEQKTGMGDAVSDSNTVATIFNQWVGSLSTAAGAITQNYVQIRAATGKGPQPLLLPPGGIGVGGGNSMLYVGGGIAALLVLGLVMSKR